MINRRHLAAVTLVVSSLFHCFNLLFQIYVLKIPANSSPSELVQNVNNVPKVAFFVLFVSLTMFLLIIFELVYIQNKYQIFLGSTKLKIVWKKITFFKQHFSIKL